MELHWAYNYYQLCVVQVLGWANPRTELSFIQGEQRELNRVPFRFELLLIPFTYGLYY